MSSPITVEGQAKEETPKSRLTGRKLLDRWRLLAEPREDGLPNRLVLLAFPVLLAVLFVVLVATGITGSSTGVYWSVFHEGKDPSLIAGVPRPIRSDEWLVQSSWVVSQEQQHFPVVNQTLPGGMDATIQNDLPTWDWSTAFRPQVAGFLFLPIDQGMAVRWWLPALGMLVACYMFFVTLLPRRPVSAALLTVAVYFTPLIQWWFLPTTIWPVAFAFFGMTAVIWAMRSRTRAPAIAFAALTGYVGIAMAMSIYVPFMIPAALVFVLFGIGVVLEQRTLGVKQISVRLIPLVSGGVLAGLVLITWVLTRWSTVQAVFNTVYPGHRIQETGKLSYAGLVSLFSGPFNGILRSGPDAALGSNQSEASTVVLWSVLLLVPLIWISVRRWRVERRIFWPGISVAVGTLLILAYLLVPGWDAVARLLLLDRTTDPRVRLGFVVLGGEGRSQEREGQQQRGKQTQVHRSLHRKDARTSNASSCRELATPACAESADWPGRDVKSCNRDGSRRCPRRDCARPRARSRPPPS